MIFVTALSVSLPEELGSPSTHAYTFNDFLNVTECQAKGLKHRTSSCLPVILSSFFTVLCCCRAGHIYSGVAEMYPDWLVT